MIGVMTGAGNHKSNTEPNLLHFPIHGGGGGRIVFAFLNFLCVCRVQRKNYTRMDDTGPNFGIFSRWRVYLRITATKKVDNKAIRLFVLGGEPVQLYKNPNGDDLSRF